MIRRLFWLTLGVVIGAWAVLRAQRFARQFGPRGIAGRAAGAGIALREFAADVRSQMHVREAELRQMLDAPARDHNYEVHLNNNADKDGH
jgi:hypothetical protein